MTTIQIGFYCEYCPRCRSMPKTIRPMIRKETTEYIYYACASCALKAGYITHTQFLAITQCTKGEKK